LTGVDPAPDWSADAAFPVVTGAAGVYGEQDCGARSCAQALVANRRKRIGRQSAQAARQTSQSGFAMLHELGPRVSEEGQSLSTGEFGARAFVWQAAQGVTPQKQIATPFSNLL